MTEPKGGIGYIIGAAIKWLFGGGFIGVGLYVMGGAVMNILFGANPEIPLKNNLVGMVVGASFFAVGIFIVIPGRGTPGTPHAGGGRGEKDSGGDGGGNGS